MPDATTNAENNQAQNTKPARPLHTKIFIGLVTGAAGGILCNTFFKGHPALLGFIKYASEPVGRIFLNLLIMVVIPLVFASLALGVAGIGNLKQLGRIGLRTMLYFLLVTAAAVTIGLVLVNTIRPGAALPQETQKGLMEAYGQQAAEMQGKAKETTFGIQTLVNIVPRNPFFAMSGRESNNGNPDMLAVIFFALMVGVGLTLIKPERAQPLMRVLEAVYDVAVIIIKLAMKLAPYGVAGLIFSVTARFGFDLLKALAWYVVTVLTGLLLHQFGVFSILVRLFARMNPLSFFKKVETIMLTAFSTSSSNATLPTTIMITQQNLGVPAKITGFVLPLGATMNMNGTALFEGVTVLFLAQVFGVQLDFVSQLIVVIMSVLTAIGAAGVPSGSIPLLIIVMQMVGVPGEGIALILGVDRVLDMCRTVLNVTGDVTCAAYVARSEGYELKA
jgi:DAACS family dicarboxylate/amino acid:cation (Na+ or H+) symporter